MWLHGPIGGMFGGNVGGYGVEREGEGDVIQSHQARYEASSEWSHQLDWDLEHRLWCTNDMVQVHWGPLYHKA